MNARYLDEVVRCLCRKSDYVTWELSQLSEMGGRAVGWAALAGSNASALPCTASPGLALGTSELGIGAATAWLAEKSSRDQTCFVPALTSL